MGGVFYVMAIMGCGDAGTACQQARLEDVRYRTAMECQAAMPAALGRNTDLSFPVITAACQQQGTATADASRAKRG